MGNYFNYWYEADAVHQMCLLLLIPLVCLFFPHLPLLNMYHFVRNNPRPGWTSSVVIKRSQKSDCWHPSSMNSLVLMRFFVSFSCFGSELLCWTYRKKRIIWMFHRCRLCGLVAFTLDFCAVLFANRELNATKIRLDTKRSVHRMYTSYYVKCVSLLPPFF